MLVKAQGCIRLLPGVWAWAFEPDLRLVLSLDGSLFFRLFEVGASYFFHPNIEITQSVSFSG